MTRRWWPVLGLLVACTGGSTETPPPEGVDTGDDPIDTDLPGDTGLPPLDTGNSGFIDDEPSHTMEITQGGFLDFSPSGGPWTSATGQLVVRELIDGVEPDPLDLEDLPSCEATFALTGSINTEWATCSGCTDPFELRFFLSEGDPSACIEPGTPFNDATWAIAWNTSERIIYREMNGSGVWVPWFEGIPQGDRIVFQWSATVGYELEDEEEE